MGEYANRGSEQVKLGTCEDLYYVTRADIEALAAAGWHGDGGMKNLRGYLDCKPCRVRLPGSCDDPAPFAAGDIHTIGKREMSKRPEYRLTVDPDFVSALAEIDHGRLCFHKAGTNFFVPCPLGKDRADAKSSPAHPHVMLTGEGLGNRRAIYRCPYCDTQFNLNGHGLQHAMLAAFDDAWGKMSDESGLRTYLRDLIACGMEEPAAV